MEKFDGIKEQRYTSTTNGWKLLLGLGVSATKNITELDGRIVTFFSYDLTISKWSHCWTSMPLFCQNQWLTASGLQNSDSNSVDSLLVNRKPYSPCSRSGQRATISSFGLKNAAKWVFNTKLEKSKTTTQVRRIFQYFKREMFVCLGFFGGGGLLYSSKILLISEIKYEIFTLLWKSLFVRVKLYRTL